MQISSLLGTRKRTKLLAGGLALAGLGYLLFGGGDEGFERWPIPEEFTRDGSGRLADLIPGDWEVICYTGPYARIAEEVQYGLAESGFQKDYGQGVANTYLDEGEFVFAMLRLTAPPTVLLIDVSSYDGLEYDLRGRRCHERGSAGYAVETAETPYGIYAAITLMSRDKD